MEQVKIKLNGGFMPKKSDDGSAAYDLYAPNNVELKYGRQVVDLGFSMELPHNHAANIQARSGFSVKGFEVILVPRWIFTPFLSTHTAKVNADVMLGLVDESYRNNVGVLLKSRFWSLFYKAFIEKGTRIAQMRISIVPNTELLEVEELDMTNDRGGGYGHSGTK